MNRSRSLCCLAIMSVGLTACGEAQAAASHQTPPSRADAQGGGGATTPGIAAANQKTAPASPYPASGAAGATAHAGPADTGTGTSAGTEFSVALGQGCLAPGGRQTLTAQSRPGYTVAFNSVYGDGKRGDAYGGYGVVATDGKGTVTTSWVVKETAPLGRVTVAVGTGNGGTPVTRPLSFALQGHC